MPQDAAAMVTDEGLVKSDQTQLDYTTLRAPFDGVTGLLQIEIGNLIQPTNTTGIVVLTQVQPISVVFILPNADIASVQEAMARGPVHATVYDQSGSKQLDVGTLLADQQSGGHDDWDCSAQGDLSERCSASSGPGHSSMST